METDGSHSFWQLSILERASGKGGAPPLSLSLWVLGRRTRAPVRPCRARQVPSLFSQPGASRAAFDKLWWQQTQEELVREAIHGPDDEKVKLHMAKRVFACKYAHQLMRRFFFPGGNETGFFCSFPCPRRRFLRIKNTKKRKLRIAQLDELVQSKVAEKFQGTERAAPTKHGLDEREDPVRVLQGGFHPDLVFLKPGLAENQRREAPGTQTPGKRAERERERERGKVRRGREKESLDFAFL